MENKNIQLIESLAANAWQAESSQGLEGWLLRFSRGITRRGNSVFPQRDHGQVELDKKIDAVEAFYSKKGQPAIFQMTQAALPAGLYENLKKRGYRDAFFTQVQSAKTDVVLKNTKRKTVFTAIMETRPIPKWLDVYFETSQYGALSAEVRKNILEKIPGLAGFFMLKDDAQISAIGLGVIEGKHLGIYCMVTPESYRRQGTATEILHALAKWGGNHSVEHIYLQVMENNQPALALYKNAGFNKQYRYWYSEKAV